MISLQSDEPAGEHRCGVADEDGLSLERSCGADGPAGKKIRYVCPAGYTLEKGYAVIDRGWKRGTVSG
jgi:hypothetical protein